MISECLNDINNPTQLDSFFNQESPYKYHHLLVCVDKKRNNNNHDISRYNLDARELNDCGEPFNVRNLNDSGLLQAGYSRKIDLDSELKRINHYDDKCYYDNFKNDPRDAKKCSGLFENKDLLVKDYRPVGKNYSIYESKLPCMEIDATNPNHPDKFNWETHKYMIDTGIKFGEFKQCPPPKPANKCIAFKAEMQQDNLPKYYQFHDNNRCESYPCQRLFYNFTKRSTIPNFHNMANIDPIYNQQ